MKTSLFCTPGARRCQRVTACGPCNASSARSGIGTTGAAVADVAVRWAMSASLQAGIDDHEQVADLARRAHDHQVVQDAARVIGEEGVALFADARSITSTGTSDSSAAAASSPTSLHLAHVRHVEQRRLRAAVRCSAIRPAGYCTGIA
jgi:hypothetical protein